MEYLYGVIKTFNGVISPFNSTFAWNIYVLIGTYDMIISSTMMLSELLMGLKFGILIGFSERLIALLVGILMRQSVEKFMEILFGIFMGLLLRFMELSELLIGISVGKYKGSSKLFIGLSDGKFMGIKNWDELSKLLIYYQLEYLRGYQSFLRG